MFKGTAFQESQKSIIDKIRNMLPPETLTYMDRIRIAYRNSVFYNSRCVDGLRIVSDIQLYLELHGYPLRGLEQAEHLLEKRIRPDWEEVHDHE